MTRRAVIVGGGNIGLGFLAPRLIETGHQVVVVTRTAAQARELDRQQGIGLDVAVPHGLRRTWVGPLTAVPADDQAAVTAHVLAADVVGVSVGARNLSDVSQLLTPGLERRRRPVDVLTFENVADSGGLMRAMVAEHAATDVHRHGFVSALVDCVVTRRPDPATGERRLLSEGRAGFVVDGRQALGALPTLPGLRVSEDYRAEVLAKLHVFSAGHATTSYLGMLRGHRLLAEAARDPEVRAGVLEVMAEGQAGLAARHGRRLAGGRRRRLEALERFGLDALGDTVARVGRDPLRKLRPDERIVGTARLAMAAGVRPAGSALCVAAALRHGLTDRALRDELDRSGLARVLERHAGIPGRHPFQDLVAAAWQGLDRDRSIPDLLAALRSDTGVAPVLRQTVRA